MTAPEQPTAEDALYGRFLHEGQTYLAFLNALDRFAAQRAAEAAPRGGPATVELEAAIKPLWLAAKPSREAQSIRASLSTAFDDPKYRQWMSDFIPDYVWDLVDIAAQRGRDSAATPPPGDAGERAREAAVDICAGLCNTYRLPELIQTDAVDIVTQIVVAALQSERTAAASQARRETWPSRAEDFAAALDCAHSQYENYVRQGQLGTEDERLAALRDALSHAVGLLRLRALATHQESDE